MYSTKTLITIFLLLLCGYFGFSQNSPSLRWEPALSYTKKLDSRWSYNISLAGRQRFTDYGSGAQNISLDRCNVRGFATYTAIGGIKLSLGYMYRRIAPFKEQDLRGYEHRIIQQLAFLANIGAYRLSNTAILEERIMSSHYETRFRYRVNTDFPLQGEDLDQGEYYFIIGEEIIYTFNSQFQELENRISLGIGKLFGNGKKLQIAIQSRYADLISDSRDHIIQLNSTYYFTR